MNPIIICSDSKVLNKVSEISDRCQTPQCEGEKQPLIVQICENDGIDKETDHTMFEVPLKRRNSDCTGDLRPIKRTDVGECEN